MGHVKWNPLKNWLCFALQLGASDAQPKKRACKSKAKSKAKASPAPVEPKSWEDMVADARLFDIILVVFILLSLYASGICRRSIFSPADAQGVELKREYTANACTFDLPKGSESQKKLIMFLKKHLQIL